MFGKKKASKENEKELEPIDLREYLDEEEPEEEKGNVEELRLGLKLRYRILIWLLVILFVFLGCKYFLKNKCKITKFEITGNSWYTDQEIIDEFKTKAYDDYSIFFRMHYAFSDMPKMAFVKKFSVELVNLHTIKIKVREKKIVGCVKIMDDYMYFDKDGMVVASRSIIMNDVPTIDGLIFTKASIGSVLEVQERDLFKDILEITQLIQKYKIKIDKIVFDKNACATLACSDGNQIFIGRQSSYDVIMQAIPNILAAAEKKTATYKLDMSNFSSSNTTFKAEFLTRPEEDEDSLPGEDEDPNDPNNQPETPTKPEENQPNDHPPVVIEPEQPVVEPDPEPKPEEPVVEPEPDPEPEPEPQEPDQPVENVPEEPTENEPGELTEDV